MIVRVIPALAMVCALAGAAASASAQEAEPAAEQQLDYEALRRDATVRAVERVGPAVANISTERRVQRSMGLGDPGLDALLRRFMGQGREAKPGQVTERSLGSGVVIDPDGYIVTNAHVVSQASRILVSLPGRDPLEAKLLSLSPADDLALLKVEAGEPLPAAPLAKTEPLIGETCLALGNPFGLSNSVSRGVVSAQGRRLSHGGRTLPVAFLQTDAAINPGNSGGPLVNLAGEVIGVTTAIYADGQGIGFAIPVAHVGKSLVKLSDPLLLHERDLGLGVVDDPAGGARVEEVRADSPAAEAGLQAGDRIVAAGPNLVANAFALHKLFLGDKEPGPVRMQIVGADGSRRGAELSAEPPAELVELERRLGFTAHDVTPAMAWKLRLKRVRGVVVAKVEPEGPAAKLGLEEGDVILRAARRRTGEQSGRQQTEVIEPGRRRELAEFVREIPAGGRIALMLRRPGQGDLWGELSPRAP